MKVVALPPFSAFVVLGLAVTLGLVSFTVDGEGILSHLITKTVDGLEGVLTTAGYTLIYNLSSSILSITYRNQTEYVGTVSLPLNTLCETPGVDTYLTCYVCNDDCIYVHNTYGGKCGPNPTSPGNTTCLCADSQADATARNISQSSKTTCDAFFQNSKFSDYIADPLLVQILRARMDVVQCLKLGDASVSPGYNSTGCKTDCVQNHGYASGVCGTATPNIGSPGYFNETQPHFCLCSNSTSTA